LITHDMGVVGELADRVAVMYAGRVVEQGRTQDVLTNPIHPYTRALIASIPRLTGDPSEARALPGLPPALTTIPLQGCVFRDRCPYHPPIADTEAPAMQSMGDDHWVACHLADQFDDRSR
jgi:peptide/nickel transport system ATP-binding protein